jgi:hypothetical protein
MSLWRKEAFERLPEMRTALQEDKSPYHFFHALIDRLERATKDSEEDLIKRIYDFAVWSLRDAPRGKTSADDIFTVVITSFFEDIPNNKIIRKDIGKRLPHHMLLSLKEAFMYHGTEETFLEITTK